MGEFFKNQNVRLSLVAMVIMFAISVFYFRPMILNKKVLVQSDMVSVEGMSKNIKDYRETHNGKDPYWSTTMFSGMPSYTIDAQYDGNILKYFRIASDWALPHPAGALVTGMFFFFLLLRAFQVQVWLALAGGIAYGFSTYHILIMEAGHYQKIYALMYAPGIMASLVYGYRTNYWIGLVGLFITAGLEFYSGHVQMSYYFFFALLGYLIFETIQHVKNGSVVPFLGKSAGFLFATLMALFANANNLYPVYEYTKVSNRGASELSTVSKNEEKGGGLSKDYAFGWSSGRAEMLTFLVPNAAGGASNSDIGTKSATYKTLSGKGVPNAEQYVKNWPTYWGDQNFTSGPYYAGIVVLLFFIAGLILLPDGLQYPLLYVTMLSVFLAMGKNAYSVTQSLILFSLPAIHYFLKSKLEKIPAPAFGAVLAVLGLYVTAMIGGSPESSYKITDLFFDFLPMYNKFRVPASILTIAGFTIPLLGLLGAAAFLKEGDPVKKQQAIVWSAGILGGILIILMAVPSILLNFVGMNDMAQFEQMTGNKAFAEELVKALQEDRLSMFRADAIRSLIFIALSAGTIFAYLRNSISGNVTGMIIAALVAMDMISLDRRYLNDESFKPKNDYQNYFTGKEADLFLKEKDKSHFRVFPVTRNPFNDGMTPYHLKSIGGYNAAKVKRYQQLIEKHIQEMNPSVLNMLNTKYIITNQAMPGGLPMVYQAQDKEMIYANPANLGAAWFVSKIIVAKTPDEALDTVGRINTATTAVVEQKDAALIQGISSDDVDSSETVELKKYDNAFVEYETNSSKERFLVCSEVFYKGWKAFLNGKELPIIQTNFVLRGIKVPAGKNKIEFKFEPAEVETGVTLSYIGSSFFMVFLALAIFMVFKQSKNQPNNQL